MSPLEGRYGLGVDNIISLNVVTAVGKRLRVTEKENSDLFWAMRGAGPNYGIVTSAVLKAYPQDNDAGMTAWMGLLSFSEDTLTELIEAVDSLELEPEMATTLAFRNTGPPAYNTTIGVSVFYHGTEEAGRKAFSSLYAVGPIADLTSVTTYNKWNAAADAGCDKGNRKPTWGVGLKHLDVSTVNMAFEMYKAFSSNVDAGTYISFQKASTKKSRTYSDDSSSYPFRSTINYHAMFSSDYENKMLDYVVEPIGRNIHRLLQSRSGLERRST